MQLEGNNFQSWDQFKIEIEGLTAIVGPSNLGKAQPLDCKILTPYGWKRMGDLRIGDRISDPDGGFGRVLSIHPQGVKPVFRVTTSDGSSTRCCDEHLWTVQTREDIRKGGYRTLELRELRGLSQPFLPNHAPVQFSTPSKLVIHPYEMGCLLGKGCLNPGEIQVSSTDSELVERMNAVSTYSWMKTGKHGYCLKTDGNLYQEFLEKVDLLGKYSWEKFIPRSYLMASQESRRELLAGLLDTDGECSKQGCVYFNTCSPALAEGVAFLARSLGGEARIKERASLGQPGHKMYCLTLRLGFNPFCLARKVERFSNKKTPQRQIIRIEEAGEAECQCVVLSTKRQLYFTDDFIVTHNSAIYRSLKSVVRNDLPAGWIKDGTNSTRVTLTDGVEVEASRTTKSATKYIVGGQEYKKLGDQVPPEVKALGYGQVELGEFRFDPIFASQFDPQFGLSWTPAQINQVLGAFASTEKLEQGKKEANRRIQEANSEAKVIGNEMSELEGQIALCRGFASKAEQASLILASLAEQVARHEDLKEAIETTLANWSVREALLRVLSNLGPDPDTTALSPILDRLGALEELSQSRTDLNELYTILEQLEALEIPQPDTDRSLEILDLLAVVLEPRPDFKGCEVPDQFPRETLERLSLLFLLLELKPEMAEDDKRLAELEDLLSAVSKETDGLRESLREAERLEREAELRERQTECPKCGYRFEVE